MDKNNIDRIIKKVEKPARYTGNEINMCVKDISKVKHRYCFCFPDVYEIGMSHLGLRILYDLYNRREDTYCERAFAPWVDLEELMRKENIPLFSLETKTPLNKFDIIGFTLQYEMSYTNILNMLDLGHIPLLAKDRKEDDPFIMAGGPCSYNSEPIADFFDFIVLGEGEELNMEVTDEWIKWKEAKEPRQKFLERIAHIEGVYVPSFYDVTYNVDGTIKEIKKNNENAKDVLTKRIIHNLDTLEYPEKWMVPYLSPAHDRPMLEIFRGCIRGCRFCQAGFLYRPVREKSVEKLEENAKALIKNTGYEELALSSLSTSDYRDFFKLADDLICEFKPKNVNLSLPSLRIDSVSLKLLDEVNNVRKSGLTFAPEAGTQRLRDVINKGITEEDILKGCDLAFRSGWNNIKLYFMIGLPTETYDDLQGIVDLANKIVELYYAIPKQERAKGLVVTVSTSTFVPKPFTPFQWCTQDDIETINKKQEFLKTNLTHKNIKYNWHDAKTSTMEAILAKGDRRINEVLLKVHEKGCKYDAWGEFFDMDKWLESFKECNLDPYFYSRRKMSLDETLPWEHINIGVTKDFFKREYNNAMEEKVTPNCRAKCAGCGAAKFGCGVCFETQERK